MNLEAHNMFCLAVQIHGPVYPSVPTLHGPTNRKAFAGEALQIVDKGKTYHEKFYFSLVFLSALTRSFAERGRTLQKQSRCFATKQPWRYCAVPLAVPQWWGRLLKQQQQHVSTTSRLREGGVSLAPSLDYGETAAMMQSRYHHFNRPFFARTQRCFASRSNRTLLCLALLVFFTIILVPIPASVNPKRRRLAVSDLEKAPVVFRYTSMHCSAQLSSP